LGNALINEISLLPKKFSNTTFMKEAALLLDMDMIVPLRSKDAAQFCQICTGEFPPFHEKEPIEGYMSPADGQLLKITPRLKDLSDPCIPESLRKGLDYNASDILEYNSDVRSVS